jgi:hypothetical protein
VERFRNAGIVPELSISVVYLTKASVATERRIARDREIRGVRTK